MANSTKKRGQKLLRKFSRATIRAGENSREHIKENLIERVSHIENIRLLILEWGLLVVALIMLATTQAFWFGDSYAEDDFVAGGSYVEATLGQVKTMNPLFATTNSEKVLSKLMFATLSTIDYSGHPNIGLAKSILPSENGRIWTVKIRNDLKWSDGEPITADDVLFTTELIKDPAVVTIYGSNLSNVKVEKNEAGDIVFVLASSYADFIPALNFPIVPKHVLENADRKTLVENSFSNSPVTSGAFSFNATQNTGSPDEQVFYLSANPGYYKGESMLSSFAVHTYGTKDDIVRAVNNGAVTATAELSGNDLARVTNNNFNIKESSLNSGAFMFFNTKKDTLKNREVRAAIRQGIKIDEVREKAKNTAALNYPLIESQIKITNYPAIPGHDVAAAQETIKTAFGDEKINLEVATVNNGYLPDVADEIAKNLESLGFNPHVSKYEESQEFINEIISKRNYDVLVYDIELGADPDLLPYYHSSQASATGLNLSNYRNALVDDLLLGARDTLDEELRIKKYESFLEYWVNDTPAIGIYQPNLAYVYNKNVRTFSDNVKLVTAIDRFVDVNDWAVNKATKNKTP